MIFRRYLYRCVKDNGQQDDCPKREVKSWRWTRKGIRNIWNVIISQELWWFCFKWCVNHVYLRRPTTDQHDKWFLLVRVWHTSSSITYWSISLEVNVFRSIWHRITHTWIKFYYPFSMQQVIHLGCHAYQNILIDHTYHYYY